jgi:CsoR family transcriptional regulator, copper-sensing transcriptional repressor
VVSLPLEPASTGSYGACGAGAPGREPILPWGIIRAMADTPTRASGTHGTDHAHDSFRHSYSKDKAQLVRRLSRIEGQVRGIARMIEREEYCVDILQQTAALRAAVDAVSIMVLEDHVQGCVRTAAERGEADKYVDEVLDVVRRTLGRPVRGAKSAG